MWQAWRHRGLRRVSLELGLLALCVLLAMAFSDETDLKQLQVVDDKLAHVFGFAGLGLFFTLGAGRTEYWFWSLYLALLTGAIEVLQPLLTVSREASSNDVWASLAGLGAGAAAAGVFNLARRLIGRRRSAERPGHQPKHHPPEQQRDT